MLRKLVGVERSALTADQLILARMLRDYQDDPSAAEQQRLRARFDEIFGQRYPHHYGLNLVLQQFCAHKEELLRILDVPQVPLHTNAAEADIREYVTRRKISGGTRHEDGRRARDTFTGLKKTCRKLAYSFWQYLLSRLRGDYSVPYLPDVIRARVTQKLECAHSLLGNCSGLALD